ncbi:RdgB/HAM1 family non-canonical purine NTP pyrophosphatase [Mycoplasma marinum]|uniref:dITP/XTP pyrophosphatase n=1 Tax=Mycoplasma marinum TaxID=1937190 RepID=A0A4R0XKX6_9MOLU|nr:RdgB/HAM1 family non-canonical purine NTP pyrophosphatase [Mycoplasma marinum]TCG11293.1 non-canonical purine NTP pyrophosphatase, RdgB/HAM1 family [Mycoplasma marinum]
MKKILIATQNKNKIKEYRQILPKMGLKLVTLADLNIDDESPENGKTFEENALQKAKFYYDLLKIPVISEDSGLEVDNLNGFPGVYSKRWMEHKNYEVKVNELIKRLGNKSNECRYVAAIAFYDGVTQKTFRGECLGKLVEPTSNHGFGYDLGFWNEEKQNTLNELPSEFKNSISHRTKALKKMLEWLK